MIQPIRYLTGDAERRKKGDNFYTSWRSQNYDDGINAMHSPLTSQDVQARSTLGIDVNTSNASLSPDQVKVAYKGRAKATHPDLGGSEQAFQNVTAAYNHLLQKAQKYEARAAYQHAKRPEQAAAKNDAG